MSQHRWPQYKDESDVGISKRNAGRLPLLLLLLLRLRRPK